MPPATAGASAAQVRERLLALLEPVVTGAGYDLEDVTVAAAGRRSIVRVVVDADGGIDLDAVADVSRVVAATLDDAAEASGDGVAGGVLAGSYVLEVSSPGVDRPLTEPRHWRRATGRLVSTTADGAAVTGRVKVADTDGVTLDVKGEPTTVSWGALGPGRVQIEFGRGEGD